MWVLAPPGGRDGSNDHNDHRSATDACITPAAPRRHSPGDDRPRCGRDRAADALGWLAEDQQRDRAAVAVAFTRHALHGDGRPPDQPRPSLASRHRATFGEASVAILDKPCGDPILYGCPTRPDVPEMRSSGDRPPPADARQMGRFRDIPSDLAWRPGPA